MKPGDPKVWRLIELATPPQLLSRVRTHRLMHPDKPLPPNIQGSIGKAWARKS